MSARRLTPTATHWGSYHAEVADGRLVALHPRADDPEPSPIADNLIDALDHPTRIRRPMVRQGYLERGPASRERRGAEPFVAVDWDTALDLVARELAQIKERHGNRAIFAGSYGWASAGRFHHAQSQLHRFMNGFGGYTRSVNTYSFAAAEVVMPHVLGHDFRRLLAQHTTFEVLAERCEQIVAFGGLPPKNAQVHAGGVGRHRTRAGLQRLAANGVRVVNVSPLREDVPEFMDPQWLSLRPGTDTALMLGIAHTLLAEGLADLAFVERYCHGFAPFRAYLKAPAKDAEWAAAITGVDAEAIRALARDMAAKRTLINVAWSLQRAEHGEQPFWLATVLAAMLGQLGLPGGGIAYGLTSEACIGLPVGRVPWAALPQGRNPVPDFIPVARIADLLLHPGEPFDYNGRRHTYPDVRLVYWAGGNPFHHHQDLNRLVRAWRRPDTVVCNEIHWNALARHCDVVLPVTTALERNDIGASGMDSTLSAMHRAVAPVGEARNDYDVFTALAERLGFAEAFTESRDEMEWLRHLYTVTRQRAAELDAELPDFNEFWQRGHYDFPERERDRVFLSAFRADPEANRLPTPSGKIEITSDTVASFGYDDCPGHPAWIAPREWLGAERAHEFPLHLISNQPKTRLHGQLDQGALSRAGKLGGREPLLIHPADAAARGIADGDTVRLCNDRGACLATAVLGDGIRPGVVQIATGAWYDPVEPGADGALELHGNPNVLTRDVGTSRLAQGPSPMTALVEVVRHDEAAPEVRVHAPPPIAAE